MKKFLGLITSAVLIISAITVNAEPKMVEVVKEPAFGNFVMINMYSESIPIYEKVINSLEKGRKTAGGKVLGEIKPEHWYIQHAPVHGTDTYYQVTMFVADPKKAGNVYGTRIIGYIDRRNVLPTESPYYDWVSDQAYYTDYVQSAPTEEAGREMTHPTTKKKFIKYTLQWEAEFLDSNGKLLGTLPKNTTIGLQNSQTGKENTFHISMYTYRKPGETKWAEPQEDGTYWLALDTFHGSDPFNRCLK